MLVACRRDTTGFQDHVRGPYLMVTALRNPLEVFVSGTQYLHKKKTKTLDKVKRLGSCFRNPRARVFVTPVKEQWDDTGVALHCSHPYVVKSRL